MLRLVTLDVTNTLLKFSRPPGEQYAAVGQLYGLTADPRKLNNAFRSSFKIREKEVPYYGALTTGWQDWWLAIVADTFRKADCQANDETLKKIGCHLNEHYSHAKAYKLVDGTIPLLDKLQSRSVKIGVISNFDERLYGVLDQLKISHYFNFILTSYSLKFAKPDSKIFEKALEEAGGKIQPSEALHIGDDLRCDYIGARSCGWHSFLVSKDYIDLCKDEDVKPDASSMFTHLSEVLPMLEVLSKSV